MCGFLVTINFDITENDFNKLLDLISHRGRDDSKTVKLENLNIFLGFKRLYYEIKKSLKK